MCLTLTLVSDRRDVAAVDLQGTYVQVRPLIGSSPRAIRKFITNVERDVLIKVDRRIRSVPRQSIRGDAQVVWHVEPSVEFSGTYRLQLRILRSLRQMLEGVDGFTKNSRIDIVIARSQDFIQTTLRLLNCKPNLSQFDGQVLMGAALCDRKVIVSNITGYLFLLRPEQRITPEMERRREPPFFRTSYRIVARNSSALAHEWMHFYRTAGLGGKVAFDEPKWFSEGFAEFWAYVAKVLEIGGDNALLRFHVVRLRDFYDWARKCPGPLSQYRVDRGTTCEYHLGTIALEYLVANYGGIEATARAFRMDGRITSFAQGFKLLFGISLEQFEFEADAYIEQIRQAELTK
jgi:hypothetical protein